MSPKPYFNMQPGRNGSTNSPGTFRTNQMARIQGSDNPANYIRQGSGLLEFIGGAATKVAMRLAAKLTGHKAIKSGGKTFMYEKGDKVTNSFQGLFNKTVKDKPAYGIDQYKYANTKGKDALKRIKDGLK
jgi:hypothetical protein